MESRAKEGQVKRIANMKFAEKPYLVKVLDKDLIVLPNVFYPGKDTILLINTIKTKSTDTILEAFAGSGAIAVFLAQNATKVMATDINSQAVKNIKQNICKYNLDNKIEALQTDIFPIEGKFDVIVANPPYTDNDAKDAVEKSCWDKNHETVIKFFKSAKNYLSPNGKIYCSWANFADFDFFEELLKENNYSFKQINSLKDEWIEYRVYEIIPFNT